MFKTKKTLTVKNRPRAPGVQSIKRFIMFVLYACIIICMYRLIIYVRIKDISKLKNLESSKRQITPKPKMEQQRLIIRQNLTTFKASNTYIKTEIGTTNSGVLSSQKLKAFKKSKTYMTKCPLHARLLKGSAGHRACPSH